MVNGIIETVKTCSKCGKTKRLSSFRLRGRSGHQAYCKVCQQQYSKRYYLANKPRYAEYASASYLKLTRLVQELKSKPCRDCGVQYPPWVMQFDHVGEDKIDAVANLLRQGNRQRILEEVKKCEVVCANCHAQRTHERRG